MKKLIFTMAIRMLGELCIITYPVKILLEVLSKTALARVSIARHLHEIDVSFYGNEKNHGFNEECFKIFSYLCNAIKGIADGLGELVKWLFHN